ncbi:hypothetical protein J4E85_010257 [Alternaria conjuncta]|uniref:uncharacterized protein n=1 Tax=Alternaria conjuncta TaxID=181017 RepID=UPI00221E765A|nr:uncharacterized protein J4E85_010257 [Alternaria conjuncta]KAI4916169.1 hypothetical protein J4E85_010257 [Alternaria conjuncta]
MSSQEGNQADATNWIIITENETKMQRFYGPFSSDKEHWDKEAKVFADQMLEDRTEPTDPNVRAEWKVLMVIAVTAAFSNPSWSRGFPIWTDITSYEGSNFDLETQTISLNQGFQKDAAIAMKKLAASENMDEYRPPNEPKATYGDGLRVFYVSVRKAEMRWFENLIKRDIAKDPAKFSSPYIMGAKAAAREKYYLNDSNWRFDKYFEQRSIPSEIKGGVQVFVDKDKAIEYAEAKAGEARFTSEKEPKNLGADQVVYEVPSEDETVGPLQGLPKHFMLYAITTARINRTQRVENWFALF